MLSKISLQAKLWMLLLLISLVLVFIGFNVLENKINASMSQNLDSEEPNDAKNEYLSFNDNETLEEGLFSELESQKSIFSVLVILLPLTFCIGFVIKFLHDRKKEK